VEKADPCARSGIILFGSCSLPQILGPNGLVVIVEIMPRMPTTLHLPVAHNDAITRLIAICNDTYKFVAYLYNILQDLQLIIS